MPTERSTNKRLTSTNRCGSSSGHWTESEAEQEKYWRIKDILSERPNAYLVRWVDIDPRTGRRYPDEWTRKDCVTRPSVLAWETWKLNNPNKRIRHLSASGSEDKLNVSRKYTRPSRVIRDSSDEEKESPSTSQPSTLSSPTTKTEAISVDTFDSSQITVEIQSPPRNLQFPIIRLPPPPSSASDYLSLASSSPREAPESPQPFLSQPQAPQSYHSDSQTSHRVVPDSQTITLSANSAIETCSAAVLHDGASESADEDHPIQDVQRFSNLIEDASLSSQGSIIESQIWARSPILLWEEAPGNAYSPALIRETVHRLSSTTVDRAVPRSLKFGLNDRPKAMPTYHSSLLDDLQTQEDIRAIMTNRLQSSGDATASESSASQASASQQSLSNSASPHLSFRDRRGTTAHEASDKPHEDRPVPSITETRPTPPRSSPATNAAPAMHSRMQRSPSPSKLRSQTQSPSRLENRMTQKTESLKHAHLSLPLHMYRDSLRAYRDQLQWAYQNGLLKRLTNETNEHISSATAHSALKLANKLCGLALHPDLIVTTQSLTQHPSDQFAKYTRSTSSKFGFLDSLFNSMKSESKEIAIFVSSGRPTQIVEDYLRGIDVAFTDSDHGLEVRDSKGLLVTLFQADKPKIPTIRAGACFDLIIGLDREFSFEHQTVTDLEQRAISAGQACLTLRLVVPFSMEHILHGRSPEALEQGELRSVFEMAAQMSFHMGRLPEERTSPKILGELIAALVSKTITDAEISIPSLDEFLLPLSPTFRGQARSAEADAELISKLKRPAESDLTAEVTTKKARSATPVLASASKHDITHVTDSTHTTSSGTSRNYASAAENGVSDLPKDNSWAYIESLQMIVKSLESQNKQLIAESFEYKKQIATLETTRAGIMKVQDSNTFLKEKNRALEIELAAARELNAASANPDLRQMEDLRQQAEQVPKLEKRLNLTQQDKDYITERYREADNAADTFRHQVSELEPQVEELRKKASGESRLCREAFNATLSSAARNALRKSRLELSIMRSSLVKKEAENLVLREEAERLKERLGAGVATRASVRAASPAPGFGSPGPGSRLGTPVGVVPMSKSRSGSRQGTPQPGSSGVGPRPKINLTATGAHRSHLREHYA